MKKNKGYRLTVLLILTVCIGVMTFMIPQAKNSDESGTEIVNLTLTKNDICREIGLDPFLLKDMLLAYCVKEKIMCSEAEVLDYRYLETDDASKKIEVFIRFHDEADTLATVTFWTGRREHGTYLDVLPCQYTVEEIEKQVWYEKEEQ